MGEFFNSYYCKLKRSAFFQGFSLFFPYVFRNSYKIRYGLALLCVGLDLWVTAKLPVLTKNIVDILSVSAVYTLLPLLLLMTGFWIVNKVSGYIQDLLFFPVINQAIKDITDRTLKKLHRLPLSDVHHYSVSQVANALKRISQSARMFINVTFLKIVPVIGKISIALYLLSTVQVLNSVFFYLLILWGIIYFYGTRWYLRQRQQAWALSDVVMQEVITSLNNTVLTRFTYDSPSFQKALTQEAEAWLKTNQKNQWVSISLGVLMGVSLGLGLYITLHKVTQGQLTVGSFVMIKGLLLGIFIPLRTLAVDLRHIGESLIDLRTVKDILDLPFSEISVPTAKTTQDGVILQNVCYRYRDDQPLVKNISLKINLGEKVLIQGPNGTGKSTLCHLMAGLYLPQKGDIWINQTNTKMFAMRHENDAFHLKNSGLYLIPQKTMLFEQSFLYNLTYGCACVDAIEQQQVLELTGLQSFANKILGPKGVELSAGEKQRLALARALLLKPKILILDESTVFLDSVSEQTILEEIFKKIATVIIVAHNFSMVKQIDRIYDMTAINV